MTGNDKDERPRLEVQDISTTGYCHAEANIGTGFNDDEIDSCKDSKYVAANYGGKIQYGSNDHYPEAIHSRSEKKKSMRGKKSINSKREKNNHKTCFFPELAPKQRIDCCNDAIIQNYSQNSPREDKIISDEVYKPHANSFVARSVPEPSSISCSDKRCNIIFTENNEEDLIQVVNAGTKLRGEEKAEYTPLSISEGLIVPPVIEIFTTGTTNVTHSPITKPIFVDEEQRAPTKACSTMGIRVVEAPDEKTSEKSIDIKSKPYGTDADLFPVNSLDLVEPTWPINQGLVDNSFSEPIFPIMEHASSENMNFLEVSDAFKAETASIFLIDEDNITATTADNEPQTLQASIPTGTPREVLNNPSFNPIESNSAQENEHLTTSSAAQINISLKFDEYLHEKTDNPIVSHPISTEGEAANYVTANSVEAFARQADPNFSMQESKSQIPDIETDIPARNDIIKSAPGGNNNESTTIITPSTRLKLVDPTISSKSVVNDLSSSLLTPPEDEIYDMKISPEKTESADSGASLGGNATYISSTQSITGGMCPGISLDMHKNVSPTVKMSNHVASEGIVPHSAALILNSNIVDLEQNAREWPNTADLEVTDLSVPKNYNFTSPRNSSSIETDGLPTKDRDTPVIQNIPDVQLFSIQSSQKNNEQYNQAPTLHYTDQGSLTYEDTNISANHVNFSSQKQCEKQEILAKSKSYGVTGSSDYVAQITPSYTDPANSESNCHDFTIQGESKFQEALVNRKSAEVSDSIKLTQISSPKIETDLDSKPPIREPRLIYSTIKNAEPLDISEPDRPQKFEEKGAKETAVRVQAPKQSIIVSNMTSTHNLREPSGEDQFLKKALTVELDGSSMPQIGNNLSPKQKRFPVVKQALAPELITISNETLNHLHRSEYLSGTFRYIINNRVGIDSMQIEINRLASAVASQNSNSRSLDEPKYTCVDPETKAKKINDQAHDLSLGSTTLDNVPCEQTRTRKHRKNSSLWKSLWYFGNSETKPINDTDFEQNIDTKIAVSRDKGKGKGPNP